MTERDLEFRQTLQVARKIMRENRVALRILADSTPMDAREHILEERRRLKAEYKDLFDQVTELLFRHDPVGINFEVNPDEYQTEVGAILPRLRNCASPEDARRVVHEEFVRWFGLDLAGSEDHYTAVADELWTLWTKRKS